MKRMQIQSIQSVNLETRRQLGAEMRPAIVSGMVTGDAPVSY